MFYKCKKPLSEGQKREDSDSIKKWENMTGGGMPEEIHPSGYRTPYSWKIYEPASQSCKMSQMWQIYVSVQVKVLERWGNKCFV